MSSKDVITVGQWLKTTTDRFKQAELENPRLDARVLIAAALSVDQARLFSHPEMPVSAEQSVTIRKFVERRLGREPVARIVGVREFWSLDFFVDASTLIPRPDSETLVDTVLGKIEDPLAALNILDIGTGSGCLVLALLSELEHAQAVAIDVNPSAIEVAKRNAHALGLDGRIRFRVSDWLNDLQMDARGPFDFIISNPPYIASDEIENLADDVAMFDPLLALSGGDDGLEAYRTLLPQLPDCLARGGAVCLEIGWDQASDVIDIGRQAGLTGSEVVKDLAGHDRVVLFGVP